MSSFHRFGSYN